MRESRLDPQPRQIPKVEVRVGVADAGAARRVHRLSPRWTQWLRGREPGRAKGTGQSDSFLEEERGVPVLEPMSTRLDLHKQSNQGWEEPAVDSVTLGEPRAGPS